MNVQNSGKHGAQMADSLAINLTVSYPDAAVNRGCSAFVRENISVLPSRVTVGVENKKAPPGWHRTRPDHSAMEMRHG